MTTGTYQNAERLESSWKRHPLRRADFIIAGLLFVAALLVRSPFIVRGETLLHSDEAIVGLMAQDISAGRHFPIYFYGQRYMGSLEAYVVAAVSPFFDNPIYALRFAPALFLAATVLVQYLMLTRWFGRRGGLMGAAVLMASSPMFMQWSISARGGYAEILLVGAALLWTYSEWFVAPMPASDRRHKHELFFGLLLGLGMWINPTIILFIAPIVLHAMMNRPLAQLSDAPRLGNILERIRKFVGRGTLPMFALYAIILSNIVSVVWVENGRVQRRMLLGVVPNSVAVLILLAVAVSFAARVAFRTNWIAQARTALTARRAMILGVLLGASPAALYLGRVALGFQKLEPALPLGTRPLGMAGETLIYLAYGLPILFSANPSEFLRLVSVGRDTVVMPLSFTLSNVVMGATMIGFGALLTVVLVTLYTQRRSLGRLLRIQPTNHSPTMLLAIGFAVTLGLFVMGGCTLDFTTIRYLIPLWMFLPGLFAAAFVHREFKLAGKIAPIVACAAWAVGQFAMYQELGRPHPLRALSDKLITAGVTTGVAEPLDAHLLSYLTQQKCRTVEFESFWPRLAHYYPLLTTDKPTDYIVQTKEVDRNSDWIAGGWPGQSPPETKRFLWPRLQYELTAHPDLLLSREKLVDGYELIRLRRAIRDRSIYPTVKHK